MEDLTNIATSKATRLIGLVTSNKRWVLQDELMCQVFSFTLYGYIFGIGKIQCFMDDEDIHALLQEKLTGLGIGGKYAEGLIEAAHKEFFTENNLSLHNELIGIGHSHALKEDIPVLVDGIFYNTEELRKIAK